MTDTFGLAEVMAVFVHHERSGVMNGAWCRSSIALFQQQLPRQRAVLAGDAGDQRSARDDNSAGWHLILMPSGQSVDS